MERKKPHFGKIVLASLAISWENRVILGKALLIPYIVLVAIDTAKYFQTSLALYFLLFVLSFAVFTVFAVTTHRIILLGVGSVPTWGLRRWTARETYFVLHLVTLSIIVLLIVSVPWFFLTSHLWLILSFLLGLYICSRLSLVFPASAIDQGVTMRLSWQLTRRHQILMVCVVALVPVLFGIPAALVPTHPYTVFLESAIDTLFTVFVIGSLSLAYSEIQKVEYESAPGS